MRYVRPRSETDRIERRLARYPEAISLVERGEASPQTAEAVALLREGLNGIEISESMGISRSRAYELLHDPLGAKTKERKAKGLRPCVDCGKPCNTDGSISEPSERCAPCATAKQSAEAKWQPEAILDAIRRWADEHDGLPPKAQEWGAASGYTHPDYFKGDWPAWNTVVQRFGSFNTALEQAGFEPWRRMGGQPRRPLTPQQLADTAAMVAEHGLARASELLGLTESGVKRRLKQHAGQPTGDNNMPKALTADAIIDRELTKLLAQAEQFREKLKAVEDEANRLKVAQRALASGVPN